MPELIGVTVSVVPDIKHNLLLFDRIAYPTAVTILQRWPESQFAAELRWLIDLGIVFVPGGQFPASVEGQAAVAEAARDLIAARNKRDAGSAVGFDVEDAFARLFAVHLRDGDRLNAVPIMSDWRPVPDQKTTQVDVVHLVIRALPMPSESHSLEDLLHFRKAMASEGLVQSLRVWMDDVASGRTTVVEAGDKLEDLVARYERALQLERMRVHSGMVETLVVTTAQIAESLAKMRWSKLAKGLFDVRRKKVDLMRAEMQLPGRELAYISRAREKFVE